MTSTPPTTICTAERFVDEMNARRVLRERALDDEHADNLEQLLGLTFGEITGRYGVGARHETLGDVSVLRMVDGSACFRDPETRRWAVTLWESVVELMDAPEDDDA